MVMIFELAIIISAATKILRRINVEDIVSIDDMVVIARSVWWRWIKLIEETRVSSISDDIVIHQYRGVLVIKVKATIGIIIFSMCLCLGI